MSPEQLLSSYGYLGILIGTFLEGETVLILGGFLARNEYLDLRLVIMAAFAGTLAGDQFFYYFGRRVGLGALEKRKKWKLKSEKVYRLLQKHQILVILGFRFLYGLRSVTPYLIGASGIHRLRFLILNAIGVAVWALLIGNAGYMLGKTMSQIIKEVRRYELWVICAVVLIGALIWMLYWLKQQKNLKKGSGQ